MAVSESTQSSAKADAKEAARDVAATTRDVANEVASTASAVAARLPEAAATTRTAVEEAARRMEAGSDGALAVGTALSVGMAVGLLLGGGNRLLVALALIPATAMGFTLLDRYAGRPGAPVRKGGRFLVRATRPAADFRPGRFFLVQDARNARRRGLRASARIGVGDAPSQASPRGNIRKSGPARDVFAGSRHILRRLATESASRGAAETLQRHCGLARWGVLARARHRAPDLRRPGALGTSVGSRTPSGREPRGSLPVGP